MAMTNTTTRLQAALRDAAEGDIVTVNASDLRALLAKSEARREAIADVRQWISGWDPNFIYDGEWSDSAARLKSAEEDAA